MLQPTLPLNMNMFVVNAIKDQKNLEGELRGATAVQQLDTQLKPTMNVFNLPGL